MYKGERIVNSKQKLLRIIFTGELVFLVGFYFLGANGLPAVMRWQKENQIIAQQVQKTRDEIQKLEQELNDWENDPFYVEQYAREKLAMARADEEIYI